MTELIIIAIALSLTVVGLSYFIIAFTDAFTNKAITSKFITKLSVGLNLIAMAGAVMFFIFGSQECGFASLIMMIIFGMVYSIKDKVKEA